MFPDSKHSSASGQCQQKLVDVMSAECEGVAEFVRQADEFTIRLKEGPLDAWAAPDGRFVIRLAGSEETIASELQVPDEDGGINEIVRHYSFSHGDRTYSCNFGRDIKGSGLPAVQFHITSTEGWELSYVDSDGDGRWDRFMDSTSGTPQFHRRDGLSWKELDVEKDTTADR
ncbi:MAG: hypothetical protein U1E05_27640 [Patescibacteria group bacterium]|nr:hypothetical protein [Patescibacteria group bacterium]